MILTIMDYSSGDVAILDRGNVTDENVETYISEVLGYKLTEVSWMLSKDIHLCIDGGRMPMWLSGESFSRGESREGVK